MQEHELVGAHTQGIAHVGLDVVGRRHGTIDEFIEGAPGGRDAFGKARREGDVFGIDAFDARGDRRRDGGHVGAALAHRAPDGVRGHAAVGHAEFPFDTLVLQVQLQRRGTLLRIAARLIVERAARLGIELASAARTRARTAHAVALVLEGAAIHETAFLEARVMTCGGSQMRTTCRRACTGIALGRTLRTIGPSSVRAGVGALRVAIERPALAGTRLAIEPASAAGTRRAIRRTPVAPTRIRCMRLAVAAAMRAG